MTDVVASMMTVNLLCKSAGVARQMSEARNPSFKHPIVRLSVCIEDA